MTPQQLNTIIQTYWDTVSNPDQNQDAFLDALAQVKAAQAEYEAVPHMVYPLGTFEVTSDQLLVVDAYGQSLYGVVIEGVQKGTWSAFVDVTFGIHRALFAYHETITPSQRRTAINFIEQGVWAQVGIVSIDTATCAIVAQDRFKPLDSPKTGHQMAGIDTHLCFSKTAYGDGGYSVFAHTQQNFVKAVYAQFVDIGENPT